MTAGCTCAPKTHRRRPARPGAFVMSLDFELHWGVRDQRPLDRAERNRLLAARAAIPHILELFNEFSVEATWATVGFLFAGSKEELEFFSPVRRPDYGDRSLNPYLENVGQNEEDDPFHYGASLLDLVASTRGQEIATHSFSHYYCMESGQGAEEFEADLESALSIATAHGFEIQSYVFPRNQVNEAYLPILSRHGFASYRGTEPVRVKAAQNTATGNQPHKRLARLADAYFNLYGSQTHPWPESGELASVGASRFLRSYHPLSRPADRLRLNRIAAALQEAAITGSLFHLWWHPEQFAYHPDENLRFLREVLCAYEECRRLHGMLTLSMSRVASAAAECVEFVET